MSISQQLLQLLYILLLPLIVSGGNDLGIAKSTASDLSILLPNAIYWQTYRHQPPTASATSIQTSPQLHPHRHNHRVAFKTKKESSNVSTHGPFYKIKKDTPPLTTSECLYSTHIYNQRNQQHTTIPTAASASAPFSANSIHIRYNKTNLLQ